MSPDSVWSGGRTCPANLGVRSCPVRKLICPVRSSPTLDSCCCRKKSRCKTPPLYTMTLVRSFFCLNVLQSSVLYQQSRSWKKVFYRHIHPQDIYGQQQLVFFHQVYQDQQKLLESMGNMAAFVNQFACPLCKYGGCVYERWLE